MRSIFYTLTYVMALLTVILLSFFVGLYWQDKPLVSFSISPDNYSQCANKNVFDTSRCLVDYVSTFYNYTIRDDTHKTLEDIKMNGGDCYDYSMLYVDMAKSLGFYAEEKDFDLGINGTKAHAIAIISSEQGYCVLDQLDNPDCILMG